VNQSIEFGVNFLFLFFMNTEIGVICFSKKIGVIYIENNYKKYKNELL